MNKQKREVKTSITYTHKDGYRVWWKIVLNRSEDFDIDDFETEYTKENAPEEFRHYHWSYKVFADGKPLEVGYFDIVGQYDDIPEPSKVLAHFAERMQSMYLGFVRFPYVENEDKTINEWNYGHCIGNR